MPHSSGDLPWASGGGPDSTCFDTWECPGALGGTELFEVRCQGWAAYDGGWQACQCVRNGRVERELPAGRFWCLHGTPDGFERIIDANRACGWSMSTAGI